jgi:hypothetical protein
MTEREANDILDQAHCLLKIFPYEGRYSQGRKKSRRKPYLRAKYIQNRKVFFEIFKEKYRHLNKRDKVRRFEAILYLRQIFETKVPIHEDNFYIFLTEYPKKFSIIVKEIPRKNRPELYLVSTYPLG